MTFLHPPPDNQRLSLDLADHYIQDDARLARAFERTRDAVLTRVAARIHTLKKGGRILDVGCAGGYFLERYFPTGWEKFGVEPSRYGAAKTTAQGIEVYQGQLSDVALPAAFFDVATVLDTLCYMQEPSQELQRLRQALKPDGLLLVELPLASTHVWRHATKIGRFLGGAPMSLLESGQMFGYGRESMRFLLRTSGFTILQHEPLPGNRQRQRHRNAAFDAYYRFSRLLWHVSSRTWILGPNFLVIAAAAATL